MNTKDIIILGVLAGLGYSIYLAYKSASSAVTAVEKTVSDTYNQQKTIVSNIPYEVSNDASSVWNAITGEASSVYNSIFPSSGGTTGGGGGW